MSVTIVPHITTARVELSKNQTFGTTKLNILVQFMVPLIDFGVLEVTLGGPERLIAGDFVKTVIDPSCYSGFVSIDGVSKGTYTLESIRYSRESTIAVFHEITPESLPSIEI